MLTLNDGRNELWQWDTKRKLTVDVECSQVHFSNKVFGRSIDIDVIGGAANIPDILLQTDKDLNAWAFVGTAENGYTKISKTFKVNRRNKPADYVFTPPEQTTLGQIMERLDDLEAMQDPDAIKNAVDDYLANNPIQIDEKDPTVPEWAKKPTKPGYTALEVGALPADTVIPTIPDNVSAFRNDAGYLTEHQDLTGYATEQYVQGYAQPKGNYLTEVPAGYAKTEDIPTKPEDIGAQPKGEYLTAVPDGYATEEYVKNKIAEAELGGEEVDLSGYAQKSELPTKVSQLQNDSGYLTAVPDGYAKTEDIPKNASDIGAQPEGDYALRSEIPSKTSDLTNDSGYITGYAETDPTVPAWAKAASKPSYSKSEVGLGNVDNVKQYSASNPPPYPVTSVNGKTGAVTITVPTVPTKVSAFENDKGYLTQHQDISGKLDTSALPTAINTALEQAKASGEFDGKDGVTPVRGVDYYTDADKSEFSEYIASELAKRGQLVPEYVDSIEKCTDTSKMYVLPDGYIYAYVYGESEAVTYTNILEGTELHLNKRINSSGSYVDLNGYVSTDYLKLAPGDVVRVNRNIVNASYDKNRVYAYNSAKAVAYGKDSQIDYYSPYTDEGNGVYSFIFGQVYKTQGNASSGTTMITTIGEEGYIRLNIGLSGSAITQADVDDLVITKNEPISAGTVAGYDWRNTGLPFVPADYEDRIQKLEKKVSQLSKGEADSGLSVSAVFAPSPQLPADSSTDADFDAENMTAQNIYDYFDALCEMYPNYITKEVLGKDASGALDVNRYVLCRHYYKAWQRVNYPKMYAWVNGSTVIYSKSVSPRIGDTLYTTNYVGTAKGAVTAVSNANQTRTVGGVVYTRDSSKDVEPTLVFTSIIGNAVGGTVYNSSQASVTKVSTITDSTMTGANGVSYVRYPMGDRSRTMEHSTVVTIGANEHGFTPDPREPAIVCARLAKDLCECRNADNLFLNHLKNEVMLIIVPVINPYGFNLGTGAGYYNKNGVNINRNYDCPGWGNLTDAGPQGEYGGSEIETQYFMNTISEPGSAVAVSVHALGYSTNGGNTLTHYQGNNFNFGKIAEIAEVMVANYNLQFTDYGRTPPDNNQGGKSPAYITWAGAVGGLIEMQAEGASAERNTAYILEADYTLLLQCINMWLSDYKESL